MMKSSDVSTGLFGARVSRWGRRSGTVPVAVAAALASLTAVGLADEAQDKARFIGGQTAEVPKAEVRSTGGNASPGGGGYRFSVANGAARVPVVVVGGEPWQMGWHVGHLLKDEINRFVPAVVAGFKKELGLDDAALDQVWSTTAAFTDDRVEQELGGLADGSGVPLRTLQHAHCLPLLMPYSCSSIAAWGAATADGHLYQTRNLDWSLEAGAHLFPALVVYLPVGGHAHVLPTFAGFIGANCGLSATGLALSEMGDSSRKEMPYNVQAPHFTTWFRSLLYDADSLTEALDIFHRTPQTKRYHFVFGDGRTDRRAVKILSHSPEPPPHNIRIWKDNDPTDELAPAVLPQVVYQDEGRGAFGPLKEKHGQLTAESMMDLACRIPIKGGNVLNAVFDATALRLWVTYAGTDAEAYQRPFVFLDLAILDGDGDGHPDLMEKSADANNNGVPDFLDAPTTVSGR
jgi:isopenicillin-N N-acyltransferase-like protein